MRRSFLVCYDIREPGRLRRVHRTLKGYGEPWQFSVFFCVLRDMDRVRLQTDLEAHVNQKEDQVLILDMGADEQKAREAAVTIGPPLLGLDGGMVVI